MGKVWNVKKQDLEQVEALSKKFRVSVPLAQMLVAKGIDESGVDEFLNPDLDKLHDPYDLPDMKRLVDRVLKARENNEKIVIYGDYDVDGITSITVLKKFLSERGLETGYYIPNRLKEGYGLNKEAIQEIIEQKYTLMITVDCGISGIEEVKTCNELGIDVIITDHHEQLDELPNAYAIIDAKRKDNTYPFRGLAGCRSSF